MTASRIRERLRPRSPWVTTQDPYLIGMLLTAGRRDPSDRRHPVRAIWDDVREFVTRDRLGYDTTRMAEVFPADWDALYEGGLSPEMAVRLVVWNTTLDDLLATRGAGRGEFRFDFERAFLAGYSPFEAAQEALGLAVYSPVDLRLTGGNGRR
jgi:hypothetical protein